MNMDEQDNLLDRVASIFLRCFLLSYALLLLWFVLFLFAGNWAYSIQAGMPKTGYNIANSGFIFFESWCCHDFKPKCVYFCF